MAYKIGIICAGYREIAPFLSMMDKPTITSKAMLSFYSGTIEGRNVVALYSGACKTNAVIATQILIDTYGCNAIINGGTAGGMDEKIKRFDTIISTESAYWDVSDSILTDFHPKVESPFFGADARLLEYAKSSVAANHFADVYFGRMITGEAFIEDEHRSEINERFSPLSVDMETAGVAHVCYVNKIPYIAVRTITDTAEHSGEDEFELNCDKAAQLSAEVVKGLIREIPA